jgi:hypothetical protein
MGLYANDRRELTLVIDTDEYSGNFERQMFAFIFGRDDTSDGGTRDLSYYRDVAIEAGVVDMDGLLEERINDPGDDGYHFAYVTICTTPGFFNVDGVHYEENSFNCERFPPDGRHPAFQSVGVFLQREPTDDELRLIKARAKLFTDFPRRHAWDARPKILGFRLLMCQTLWSSRSL